MPSPVPPSCDTRPRHLRVEVEANPNSLLRLLEPFVVADILPHRLTCAPEGDSLTVHLAFLADDDLAARLVGRLDAMVAVRRVSAAPGEDAGALGVAA